MTGETLDQKRAKHALDCVKTMEKQLGKYVTYVNALPASILANGLGQALATERAASEEVHHELANHVADWLLSAEAQSRFLKQSGTEDAKADKVQKLLHRIVEGDQSAYLWAQPEAIAYLAWLKRFANAFLKKPEVGGGGENDRR